MRFAQMETQKWMMFNNKSGEIRLRQMLVRAAKPSRKLELATR